MSIGRSNLTAPISRKLGRIGASLLLASGLLLTAPASVSIGAISPSFVTRSGAQLLLDGQPFRFTGINIYGANSDGWCGEDYTADQLRTAFDGIGGRNTVLRSWFFQPLAAAKGPDGGWTGVRDWTHFDQTLAIAREKGVHVIATLTDQWGECGDGGAAGYKNVDWYLGGYLAPEPVDSALYAHWVSYRDWVAEVVARYKDDPTIMAWQLINEAEDKTSRDAGCPAGNINDPMDTSNILKRWAQDVGGLIRQIDHNHLISLGTIGGGQCGTQVWQYANVHDIPEIDLCEYHDYDHETMGGDQWNGLRVRIDQCAALGKPLFIGESGLIPNTLPGGTLADRAELYDAKFRAQFAAGVQGELVWAYRRTGSTLNTFDIGNGDPTLLRLQAWSPGCDPANYQIAYTKEPPRGGAGSPDLYLLDPATGAQRRLTVDVDHGERTVSWSPDGTHLSYLTGGGSYIYNTDLRTVAVDGSGVAHLTGSNANPAFEPAWSPDGSRIAFVANVPNLPQVAVINSDGTGMTLLGPTQTAEAQSSPSWSPDGSRIAYVAGWGGDDFIKTMRSDGTDQVTVLAAPGLRYVTWSPDGARLAFTKSEFNNGYWRAEIYVMNADGTGQVKLTGGLPNLTYYRFSRPSWVSSDRLLFDSSDVNARSDLYEMNADGTGLTNLTNTPTVDETDPAWRPARIPPVICAPEPPSPTIPDPPINVIASSAAPGTADVSWNPPISNGGAELLDYTVFANGISVGAVTAGLTRETIQGLVGGTYSFTVSTQNILGRSAQSLPSSSVVVAPAGTPPDAPTNVTAAAGDGMAIVSWTAPGSVGPGPLPSPTPLVVGQAVTAYSVVATPGGATQVVDGSTTSTIFTGLTNGTAYAFTVQAANDFGTGPLSNPSIAVTPLANAPPPQIASAPIGVLGGTVSTDSGSGATALDPVVTSVTVPSGAGTGTVTIAETATTVSPPPGGYQFVGQQVNITSNLATSATNPLTIVLTIDESLLRSSFSLGPTDPLPAPSAIDVTRAEGGAPAVIAPCASTGGGGLAIDPDPCVSERIYVGTDLRITILTSTASQWNLAIRPVAVSVTDTGFSPSAVVVPLGGAATWTFSGSLKHSVTNDQKLAQAGSPLFDSGALKAGRYGYVFIAAGTYTYRSTVSVDRKFAGSIGVPVVVTPSNGTRSTLYTLTWASRTMTGFVFDLEVRVKRAGSRSWSPWVPVLTGTTAVSVTTTWNLISGTYEVHARLRYAATGAVSGWSPATSVDVGP